MYKRSLYFLKKSFSRSYSATKSIASILQGGELGQQISVQGWIKSLRKQKELTFLDISDGSTPKNLQVVLSQKLDSKISVGSSVTTSGILKQTPKGQTEIAADKINLLGECDITNGYPFAPRKHYAPEYLREYLHFRPRTRKFSSVLRLRHATTQALHQYLDEKGYINIHTPILTSNDCEGAGEVFKVLPDSTSLLKSMVKGNVAQEEAFFDKKAFLTVSGQLHLEAAAHSLKKVYCLGPTFRAENSRSRYHLSEFYMLEIEKAFLENLEDLLNIVESLIKNVTLRLLDKYIDDIEVCTDKKLDHSWIDKKFIKVTFLEGVDILTNKLKKGVIPKDGFSKEHELALTEYFGQVPVFVVNWPKTEKPFYMKEIDDINVAAFDLLAPRVGELVGGSLRENNYEKLKSRLPEHHFLNWYLDLRKFGSVPTGGFGLGFERYIQFILGIENIKDSIPFPRWPHHCDM